MVVGWGEWEVGVCWGSAMEEWKNGRTVRVSKLDPMSAVYTVAGNGGGHGATSMRIDTYGRYMRYDLQVGYGGRYL